MKQISASVGLLGVNRQEDVRTVQELLNQVPHADGGPLKKLDLDGICGRKTNGAIEKLQARNWGWRRVTTRVDPDSPTWKLLLSYEKLADDASGPVTPAADPPKADPPRLVSRSFMIAMAARPGQQLNVNGENFYFLVTDRFNQSQRALYFFGNMNAPPPPPQPLTWSITIPPIVTTPEPIGAADWAGDGIFTETQDRSGVRSRMFVFPTVLNRHGVGFELRAHLDEPSSGPGGWRTSSSAPFSLVDALTVYYWQKEGRLQL